MSADTMATLNKYAADIAGKYTVHACTDITGFGLLGHACEMIEASKAGLRLFFSEIPCCLMCWNMHRWCWFPLEPIEINSIESTR